MNDLFAGIEPLVHKSAISIPYSWWAGETASRFYTAIRDQERILGTKCPECKKVYLPPRKVCPACFVKAGEWVELGPEGEVVSFTVVQRQLPALKKPVPVIFALVRLEGAHTALLHYLGEVKPEQVKIGMRVRPKFARERKGQITDIEYFRPL